VPISELQAANKQLEIEKQRTTDFTMRFAKLVKEKAALEKKIRVNDESDEKLNIVKEEKEAIEEEFEIIKKRLENLDPMYKWENSIYQKVANILKRAQVSPIQAFEEFDSNGDGVLNKAEFQSALFDKLRVSDITNREFEIIWDSLDADNSNCVDYKEFVRKLEQYGVKNLGKEEFILTQMVKACHNSNISISDFFEMIDKNKRGYISREDFKDILDSLDLKLKESEAIAFIDNFWRDKTAGIDYKGFLKIFAKLEIQVLNKKNSATTTKRQTMIKDETIRVKKDIFDQIKQVLDEQGKNLGDVFRAVDNDGSYEIDVDELFGAFKGMHLNVSRSQT